MNGARLNFSHGNHAEQAEKIQLIKETSATLQIPVAIILDTKGPEIRTGKFEGGKVSLTKGETFTLTTKEQLGNQKGCSVSYEGIITDVRRGDTILIDDGLIALTIKDIKPNEIMTEIENDGELSDHKSINLPGTHVNLPSLTEDDKKDILFGITHDIDYVAASFTRTAEDVLRLRAFLDNHEGKEIRIISKIENKEGVNNIDEIIEISDAVMIARGDLGVEIPQEQVPILQKEIIKKCNRKGRLVITATQMLDSMIRNPRPTRAEVADVANAIFDGTDCVMLSGETATGEYPVNAVQMMASVAAAAEGDIDYPKRGRAIREAMDDTITKAVGFSACSAAESLCARAILTPTTSGYTAAVMASFRPDAPIAAYATTERVMRRMTLYWGVQPYYHVFTDDAEGFFQDTIGDVLAKGSVESGDYVILVAGHPFGIGGTTNMMRVQKV
jgi:pyruvate kinase